MVTFVSTAFLPKRVLPYQAIDIRNTFLPSVIFLHIARISPQHQVRRILSIPRPLCNSRNYNVDQSAKCTLTLTRNN
jgi:hypothetical protein